MSNLPYNFAATEKAGKQTREDFLASNPTEDEVLIFSMIKVARE